MSENPYKFGMGLSDPKMFVGRQKELNQAVSLLRGLSPSCVAISGPTRIGKTTLLERIMETMAMGAERQPQRCVALPPLQIQSRDTMFRHVVNTVARAMPQLPKIETDDYTADGFLDWLNRTGDGVPTLLFMDDFDDLHAPDELRFELYDVLRAAVWKRPLAICLSTRHSLAELCRQGEKTRSLLWNIFTTIDLGLLSIKELRDLIYKPHAEAGLPVNDEEWEIVLAEAGPYPCLAQIAGSNLFEAKRQAGGALSQEQLYHLSRAIRRAVSHFFPSFLDHLKERDSRLVEAAQRLAARGKISDAESDDLIQMGMAYRTPRGARLMSDAFGEYLLSQDKKIPSDVPPQPVRGGARVFLCHSSKDREFAEKLCHDLFDHGIDVWADWISMNPGEMFDRAIEKALMDASHVVLVATPDAIASNWVRSEVEWALHAGKTVIPIISRRGPLPLPPRWHSLQACDASTEEAYSQALMRLVSSLPRRI